MQRALLDAPWTLRANLVDADGELVADATAATAALTDQSGTAMTGSPFNATGMATGQLAVSIPAASIDTLGVYDVLWTISRPGGAEKRRGQLEVVGGFLFGLDEFRAAYPDFADDKQYPARLLRSRRDEVEDLFEEVCRPAFRHRRRRVVLDGTGSSELLLDDLIVSRLVSASIDDVALTVDELAAVTLVGELGVLHRESGSWTRGRANVVVVYEHGLGEVPEDVHLAAMSLAKARLSSPAHPDRATSLSTDGGSYRLLVAGRDGVTALPEVDAVINRWGAGNRLHAI